MNPPRSKTLSLADLSALPVRDEARALSRFTRRLFLGATPLAINGIARRRWYVRRFKLWEYACGLAQAGLAPGARVLEFGGAAGLPSYALAARGMSLRVLELDAGLTRLARDTVARRGWDLAVSEVDATRAELPPDWTDFDFAMSFCVIEHMPCDVARRGLERVVERLAPGGRMALTFEYGEQAPGEGALRTPAQVDGLVEHLGLDYVGSGFEDTGERFTMDRRHPERSFTFGIVHVEKRG